MGNGERDFGLEIGERGVQFCSLIPVRRSRILYHEGHEEHEGFWEGWDQIDLVWDEKRLGGSGALPETQVLNPESSPLNPVLRPKGPAVPIARAGAKRWPGVGVSPKNIEGQRPGRSIQVLRTVGPLARLSVVNARWVVRGDAFSWAFSWASAALQPRLGERLGRWPVDLGCLIPY
jgi:hypothetical protein